MDITTALETILSKIDIDGLADHERNAYNILRNALDIEKQRRTRRPIDFLASDFYQ